MSLRSNTSAGSSSSIRPVGKTPVPFLLGGVGIMLVLIVFAVIILAWSYFKESTTAYSDHEINNRSSGHHHTVQHGDGGRGPIRKDLAEQSDDKDERVIVIMAGDQEPTFIAKRTFVAVEV